MSLSHFTPTLLNIDMQVLLLRSFSGAYALVCILVIAQNHERNWRQAEWRPREVSWIDRQAMDAFSHLLSVPSSQWGTYKGTLIGVSHLDLINWTNRLKWLFWSLTGTKQKWVWIHRREWMVADLAQLQRRRLLSWYRWWVTTIHKQGRQFAVPGAVWWIQDRVRFTSGDSVYKKAKNQSNLIFHWLSSAWKMLPCHPESLGDIELTSDSASCNTKPLITS